MIAIIDYGVGNLRSVQKACEYLGLSAEITGEAARVARAGRVILPGVGAFAEGMRRLCAAGLDAAVHAVAASGRPLLGICLGMQLLYERGEEGEGATGLGLLPGAVTRLPAPGLKVPHVGWNTLSVRPSPLFTGLPPAPCVYFVHSYGAIQTGPHTIATADYGGLFTAAAQLGSVYGTQFHPEKSGDVGLAMLKNFAAL
ncbi:MAG: imidazole glycerol phosphate synthase subunit HisH [Oscillospiraceae bacterium]|nr:imidazole glycerol phosphate synthase subunit HisH [Oscillospiraceae bacterium]